MIVSYHLVLRTAPAALVDKSSFFCGTYISVSPLLVAHVVWYLESMDGCRYVSVQC